MMILPATAFDLAVICRDMRKSDRQEVEEAARATGRFHNDWTIEEDMRQSFAAAEVWAMWRGDDLIALGGVAPVQHSEGVGAIWMIGTDLMDRHILAATRACRRFMVMAHKRFPVLGNIVPNHMILRLRWLAHLGFDTSGKEAQLPISGYVTFWAHHPDGPFR